MAPASSSIPVATAGPPPVSSMPLNRMTFAVFAAVLRVSSRVNFRHAMRTLRSRVLRPKTPRAPLLLPAMQWARNCPCARSRTKRRAALRQMRNSLLAPPSSGQRYCSRACGDAGSVKPRPKCEGLRGTCAAHAQPLLLKVLQQRGSAKTRNYNRLRFLSPSAARKSCANTLRCMWRAGKAQTPS
jgi:hypothetical protein